MSSEDCEGPCDQDKYLLTKVREVKAETESCPEDTSKDCPISEPQYDKLSQDFILQAVGAEAALYVCNPAIYSAGQWLRLQNGTKVQISAIEENNLIVRNACADGQTAISSNANPGTAFAKESPIWLTEEPDCSDASICNAVLECLKSSADIQIPGTPELEEGQKASLIGSTLVNGCEEQQEGGLVGSYLRRILKIFAKDQSKLCYPDIAQVDGNKVNDVQKQFVVMVPGSCEDGDENCFQPLEVGTDGIFRICGGDIKFIENARVPIIVTRELLLQETIDHADISGWSRVLALPNFPDDCGNGVCVQIEAQAYGRTTVSDDLFRTQYKINGQEIMLVAGNEQVGASSVPFPGTANGSTIICQPSNQQVTITATEDLPMDGGEQEVWVWISMYYV